MVSGCDRKKPRPEPVVERSSHAQLLQEMYRVVFLAEPKNVAEFNSYVEVLEQGASLEGVYNGFVHSDYYRDLEKRNSGAAPEALNLFLEILTATQLELGNPKVFDSDDAQPLSYIEHPTGDSTDQQVPQEFKGKQIENDPKKLTTQYRNVFLGASFFTLKRILGDELLKLVEAKSGYKENLALWYSKWAVGSNQKIKIDFGLRLRNSNDEKFHYAWALNASPDAIRWEVLNRIHRLMNQKRT